MKLLILLLLGTLSVAELHAKNPPILGQWISDKKDLIVEVYQDGTVYKGRIVWVTDRSGQRLGRLDEKNPILALRNRNVIGIDVLEGLTYNQAENCFENGHIYDATSGKTYSASARLDDTETLVVRGYWGFQILGKTLKFTRYKQALASGAYTR
jgi:uncharacterized protein (DUF2147 family)